MTPVGRILTRCTQDIGTVDSTFPYMFTTFFYMVIQNISLFVITVIQARLYALIPGSILAIVGGYMSSVYLKAQINVKREMNVRRAPVISQLGVALAGLRKYLIPFNPLIYTKLYKNQSGLTARNSFSGKS